MDPTLLSSIIALSGVVISALISSLIANRTAKLQITRIRYEIQHSKAEKLTEKRLEAYPSLYTLLNRLNFLIRDNNLNVEEFEQINDLMNEWYLKNGIYLSSKCNTMFWVFLKKFRKLCRGGSESITDSLGVYEQRKKFVGTLESIELELKNEIGVYEIEYFDPNVRFTSYQELMAFYRERTLGKKRRD